MPEPPGHPPGEVAIDPAALSDRSPPDLPALELAELEAGGEHEVRSRADRQGVPEVGRLPVVLPEALALLAEQVPFPAPGVSHEGAHVVRAQHRAAVRRDRLRDPLLHDAVLAEEE